MTVGGEFWVPDTPERRVRGEFVVSDELQVSLQGGLVDDPLVRPSGTGWALIASASKTVESFLPVTIHGELESGQIVTLLDGQNYGGHPPFGQPLYKAHMVLRGAHVMTNQQYRAVRFRLGHPYWLGHLNSAPPVAVEDDNSTLAIDSADEAANWLVYEAAVPMTLRQLEMRVVTACRVLAELALHVEIDEREMELRIDPLGEWLTVLSADTDDMESGRLDPDSLLPREELTVERFAAWIALDHRLDGLAAAVARKQTGPLQVLAPVATSVLEGLHRRLPYSQSKFPSDSRAALKRVRRAAADAARAQAASEGLDAELVAASLAFFGEVSFRDRATEVVSVVSAAVPEIAESVPNLPALLTETRNELAHHLIPDEVREPLEARYLRWILVSTVTPWLLRCLLLLHAGVDPNVLHERLLMSKRFEMQRANTAQHVKELAESRSTPS